jgi:hypothetical protein
MIVRRARSAAAPLLLVALAVPAIAIGADDDAGARIAAMARFLSGARRVGVVADCSYDVVQDTGQKIEFGERRRLTLRRPDRARIDVTRRDGTRRGVVFDGARLTAFDLDQKVYAVVEKPGTVDAAFEYFVHDLNMRLPLRELFASDLPKQLKEALATARSVGREDVGGAATDHVALRGDDADVQLWIRRSGDPLPQRIVITYRLAAGMPQFAADFSEWALDPDVPDASFTFTPEAGAERIPILPPAGTKRQ